MLKRKIGDKVFINPYSDVTGVIIDSKEVNAEFNPNWDYKVKFDSPVSYGFGPVESEYFNDVELDKLLSNWNVIKGIK